MRIGGDEFRCTELVDGARLAPRIIEAEAAAHRVEGVDDLGLVLEGGWIDPRNASIGATAELTAAEWARHLDLQIRQSRHLVGEASTEVVPHGDVAAPGDGLDDQVEPGSSTTLKDRNAVDRHPCRGQYRSIRPG